MIEQPLLFTDFSNIQFFVSLSFLERSQLNNTWQSPPHFTVLV